MIMEKTREEFTIFVHQAMHDRKSPAYIELYRFLVTVFVKADLTQDGKVLIENVDSLIDEAAALPRLYGYAPTNAVLYPSVELRKAARVKMFSKIDKENNGYISLEQWISFANAHILGKLTQLPVDYLGASSDKVTSEEFIEFMKMAVHKGTPQYRQLYFFLLKCFQMSDTDCKGSVDYIGFDKMIEYAAAAPRRFGLAPKTSDMFKSERDRLTKRKADFATIDLDSSGSISFSEWLDYAYLHILGKVVTLL